MSFIVRLETQRQIVLDELVDTRDVISRLLVTRTDPAYQCIRFIDPYGDTVFNVLQMPQFLREWVELEESTPNDDAVETIRAVRALAERCRDEVHLYLRFMGD